MPNHINKLNLYSSMLSCLENLLCKTEDIETILDHIFSLDMLKKLEATSYCDLIGLLAIQTILSGNN